MKYVMFETTPQNDGEPRFIPVIFPKELVHAEVAAAIGHVLKRQGVGPFCVRSAGEVTLSLDDGAVRCGGESETLKAKSHADDADIIQMHDYCHGRTDSMDTTKAVVQNANALRSLRATTDALNKEGGK